MGEFNPKVKSWIPPPDAGENPYKSATILRQVIEHIPQNQGFERFAFDPPMESSNPYVTAEVYQQQTGVRMGYGTSVRFEDNVNVGKSNQKLLGKSELGRFEVRHDGIYLRNENNYSGEATKLCNFYFDIKKIYVMKNRNEASRSEILYIVDGEDFSHNFEDEKDLPTISEENFSLKIVEDILCKYPECYIIPESKYTAKEYLKEYAAIIYRNFRKNNKVEEYFAYSGWATVQGRNVYLSDSRRDCKCGVFVPKISSDRMCSLWRDDLSILGVQRKVYNSDGTLNEAASLKIIFPFWLYLHLGFACKLFLDAGMEVQFIFLLVGKTGSFKTTLCKTFAEPFNEGSMLRFESTAVALENYREQCIDQNMIVDDIFKKDIENIKKFEVILRAFGDGTGRAKATGKDYKEISRSEVRGGCIVTAEHDLNSQQSSVLRYVTDTIETDSIDKFELKKFQDDQVLAKFQHKLNKIQEIFGAWITYLEENYIEIVQQLMTFQAPPLQLKFKRHQQIYRVLCATSKIILDWGTKSGAIDSNQAYTIFDLWNKIIADFMLKNQIAAMTAEPYQKFLITLQQAIATGAAPMATSKEAFEKNGNRYVGFYRADKDDHEYVFAPDKIMTLVRRQLLDSGQELIAESTAIFKELREHGISKGYDNQDSKGNVRKRYLKRIKINGHLIEMLVISKVAMEKVIEDFFKEG